MTSPTARTAPEIRPNARLESLGPSLASRRRFLLGSLAAAAVSSCAIHNTKPSSQQAQDADRIAAQLLAANPMSPAVSAAVASPDGVIWTAAVGLVDVELDVPATPAHRFKLGSVSKVVTASLAARLAARGAVDLDAPISHWLGDLPEPHRQTTLRQLLNHQGGVRHYANADFDNTGGSASIDFRAYPDNEAILAVFIDDPLVAEPGISVNYSTFGYTLASIALEAATDTPFLDLIAREISAPLDLQSLAADDPVALRPMRARGYGLPDDYRVSYPFVHGDLANARQTNPAYKWAGGGLIATPSDLARFGAAHLDTARFSDAEREILFTPRATWAAAGGLQLGLGWRLDADEKGRRRWHHAGGQEGGRASLVVYPDHRLSIAFALNGSRAAPDVLTPSAAFADAFL